MQWPSEGENAARWIHWYAITIGLFVLLPRAVLALVWRLRANRLARTLPFREVSPLYFERLLSTSTGASLPLRLVPYAFSPDAACRSAAAEQLERQFGRTVTLHLAPAIPFGEEETVTLAPLGGDVENAEIVPLFHFAATPELETHLTVYENLSGLSPKPVRYVLLDTTSFDRRSLTFSDAQVRREGRRAAWERLFEGKDITIIPFSASSALTPS